jgi:hypothetical protein
MVQSDDCDSRHPFAYGKVLGVYHADIIAPGASRARPALRRIDFLWVRWFEEVAWGGWSKKRLDRVAYIEGNGSSDAFGFLDPACVIRGAHLIPAFEFGRSMDNIPASLAWDNREAGDWDSYFISR